MAIALVGSADSGTVSFGNSTSITFAGTPANGELIVLWTFRTSQTDVATTPAGFTKIGPFDDGSSSNRIYIFWKIAASESSATYTVSYPGSNNLNMAGFRLSGTDTTTPIEASGAQSSGTFFWVESPDITTLTANAMHVALGGSSDALSSWAQPSSYTTILQNTGNGQVRVSAVGKIIATAGATGVIRHAGTGNQGFGASLSIKPAGAGGGSTPVSSSDTGSGADASTLSTARTQTETGAGADGAAKVGQTSTETAAGTDTTVSIRQTSTDTGAGADAQSIVVTRTQTETATGADAQSVVVLGSNVSQSDTGTGVDAESVNTGSAPATQTDTGTGADNQTLTTTGTQPDTGAGTEGTGSVAQTWTDTAVGADVGTLTTARTQTDTGAGADAQSVVITAQNVLQTDNGTATDNWSIVATRTQTDTGSGLDDFVLWNGTTLPKAGADTGIARDGATIQVLHPATGAPGFTKLQSYNLAQRQDALRRNMRPGARPRRWPGGS